MLVLHEEATKLATNVLYERVRCRLSSLQAVVVTVCAAARVSRFRSHRCSHSFDSVGSLLLLRNTEENETRNTLRRLKSSPKLCRSVVQ